jgi:two-component sensor histidine kinase
MALQEQAEVRSPTDSRRLEVRVPARPGEVSGVRDALADLGLPPRLLEDARLLLSELVTNSIRHAGLAPGDRIRIQAAWSGTRLRVDVRDRSAASDDLSKVAGGIRPGPGSESGWGLYLVDSLASRWGTARGRYWFEMEHDGRAELPRP